MSMNKQDIINMARVRIGQNLSSSDPESDVDLLYDTGKKFLLESRYWTFAKTSQALVAAGDVSYPNWKYAFRLPTNLGRIFATDPSKTSYDIYESYLVTDINAINLIYSATDIEDGFPAYFGELLSLYIAKEICTRRTGSNTLLNDLQKRYAEMYLEAGDLDSKSVPPLRFTSARYIEGR